MSQEKPQPPEISLADIAADSEPSLTAGSCVLRQSFIAQIVQDALVYFEGERYRLAAWCIMPNHVHVVVQPMAEYRLQDILHTWKSYTANRINRRLNRQGAFWERESFDHLIRRPEHAGYFISYTERNPVNAGLCVDPADWPFSSCGTSFQHAIADFIPPRKCAYVNPRSRGELPHLHKTGGTYFVTWRQLDAVTSRQ